MTVADSLDGRTFFFRDHQGAEGIAVVPGDVVVLTAPDGGAFLAQVLTATRDKVDGDRALLSGAGSVIGALSVDGPPERGERRPFSEARLQPASRQQLAGLQGDARLTVGTWRSSGIDVAGRLKAAGFNRHTFLCGQSGSGKTYALGVILEQLMLGTDLRMVVLDPNADFVKLGELRPDAPAATAQALQGRDVRVLGANQTAATPLRLRFSTMPQRAQAAVLQLDPLRDRGEYNLLLHRTETLQSGDIDLPTFIAQLHAGDADERALAQRVENLGLVDWEVWALDQPSADEIVESAPGLTVLNLSGFRDPDEPLAVCLGLIERLWAKRESRIPTVIVIDEAHNICPAKPSGPLQTALVSRLIQIAAEGRKYGLWLFLSTQRPSKIHPEIVSQCDNLVLMRINSAGDVADLTTTFGFAPPAMLASSQAFVQGEALIAGAIAPAPAIIRMGKRLTHEGGSDVAVPMTD
jgi:uncharacterized protein